MCWYWITQCHNSDDHSANTQSNFLLRLLLKLNTVSTRSINWYEHYWTWTTKVLAVKLFPMSVFCETYQTWTCLGSNLAQVVRSQWSTALAMERPDRTYSIIDVLIRWKWRLCLDALSLYFTSVDYVTMSTSQSIEWIGMDTDQDKPFVDCVQYQSPSQLKSNKMLCSH